MIKRAVFWILLFLLFVLVGFVVYKPALFIGFLSDDWGYVYMVDHTSFFQSLRFLWQPDAHGSGFGNYRPLASIAMVLMWKPFLYAPVFLHGIALVFHAVSSLLLSVLVYLLFRQKVTAVVAGMVFLLFPLNVEVVSWLCAAWNTSLAIIPLLLALIIFAGQFPKKPNIRLVLIVLLTLVSLLAKEFGLLMPVIVFLLACFMKKKQNKKLLVILIFLDIVYLLLRNYVLGSLGGYQADGSALQLHFAWHNLFAYLQMPFFYLHNYFNENWLDIRSLSLTALIMPMLLLAGGAIVFFKQKKNEKLRFLRSALILLALIYLANLLGWNLVDPRILPVKHSRILYLSNAFFAILIAYIYYWGKVSWFRSLIFAYIVLLPFLAYFQLMPWVKAGQASQAINRVLIEEINNRPNIINMIVIEDLPDNYQTAFIYRNGIEYAISFYSQTAKNQIELHKKMQDQLAEPVYINNRKVDMKF